MTQIAKGLEGVLFTESKLTFINGSEGILTHLGIPIQEWAEKSTFEELSLALLDAELAQRDEWWEAVRVFRALVLADLGREREALSDALHLLAGHLPMYQRSVRHDAAALLEAQEG